MAKTKAEFLEEANKFGLKLSEKNTVEEIKNAIASASGSTAKPAPDAVTEKSQDNKDEAIAKAGKRSKKAIEEAKEKQAKAERKKSDAGDVDSQKPKQTQKPTRPRIERQGKRFKEAAKLVDKTKNYSLIQALELACRTSTVKFDASVEMHVRLNVNPKQADQNIRDSIVLPEGTGKSLRVAVFAGEDDVKKAKAAGADVAGSDDFLKQLEKSQINFDTLISTPDHMSKLAKYARLLGPKGLMPNPKSGTVAKDIEQAVMQAKAGKIEYRVDSYGIVHAAIGKVSFGKDKLLSNAQTLLDSIKSNKPDSIKGSYITASYVTTAMGPSIKFS